MPTNGSFSLLMHTITPIGFSTGALELGDFRKALHWISGKPSRAIELSAIRFGELEDLVQAFPVLDLRQFSHVSFHAPSNFTEDEEVGLAAICAAHKLPTVLHPDVIINPSLWLTLGSSLLVENMDHRKRIGQTTDEIKALLELFPEAGLCLDMAHARKLDPSLGLLHDFLTLFSDRIREIHISEIDDNGHHFPMSDACVEDFKTVSYLIPRGIPVIIESMLRSCPPSMRDDEYDHVRSILEFSGHSC